MAREKPATEQRQAMSFRARCCACNRNKFHIDVLGSDAEGNVAVRFVCTGCGEAQGLPFGKAQP